MSKPTHPTITLDDAHADVEGEIVYHHDFILTRKVITEESVVVTVVTREANADAIDIEELWDRAEGQVTFDEDYRDERDHEHDVIETTEHRKRCEKTLEMPL